MASSCSTAFYLQHKSATIVEPRISLEKARGTVQSSCSSARIPHLNPYSEMTVVLTHTGSLAFLPLKSRFSRLNFSQTIKTIGFRSQEGLALETKCSALGVELFAYRSERFGTSSVSKIQRNCLAGDCKASLLLFTGRKNAIFQCIRSAF
jgi:hypothetical protein